MFLQLIYNKKVLVNNVEVSNQLVNLNLRFRNFKTKNAIFALY